MTAVDQAWPPRSFRERRRYRLIFVKSSTYRARPPTPRSPENFQTFLTLLTTQLQNQNPLDPLDTNQFTQQLVQFAGVEQQLKTNDQLTTLVSLQQTAQSTQALTFVGKTAVVDGSTAAMTNGSATWELGVPTRLQRHRHHHQQHRPDRLHRQLRRERRQQSAFTWNGKGNDGTQWPDGKYKLTATATDSAGNQRGGLDRDPGHGQFGRSDPVPAAAVDRRPELHDQPDQEHRQLSAGGSPRRIGSFHDQLRPIPALQTAGRSRSGTAFSRRFVLKPWA